MTDIDDNAEMVTFDEPAWVENTPLNELAVHLYWARGFGGNSWPLPVGKA